MEQCRISQHFWEEVGPEPKDHRGPLDLRAPVQQQRSWEYDVMVEGLGAGVLLCTVLCSLCWCLAIASCRRRREAARLERESRSSELERGAVEVQQQQQKGKKTSTKKK